MDSIERSGIPTPTKWYMIESPDTDAHRIELRNSDERNMELMSPPPVGAVIECATEGNHRQVYVVKEVIWDLVRGLVRVVVERRDSTDDGLETWKRLEQAT